MIALKDDVTVYSGRQRFVGQIPEGILPANHPAIAPFAKEAPVAQVNQAAPIAPAKPAGPPLAAAVTVDEQAKTGA